MSDESLIKLESVSLNFAQTRILSELSFEIYRNKILTIIGPNGAGKSSLIKLIAGLYKPSQGRIVIPAHLSLGYVPQKLFLNQSMPIKVSRFLSLTNGDKSKYKAALEQVNAAQLWARQMHKLSGGEQQRVLLARAIARAPDVLLLDEPLQGVDIQGQLELYKLISDIRFSLNCAVVMVSHDLHLVMAKTEHVICLNRHICCQGQPENVSQHPEYLNMFGTQAAKEIAVYAHHHDHHHNLDGAVSSMDTSCRHD